MSHKQPRTVDATMYVQLAPEWERYWEDDEGNKILAKAKHVATTLNKPPRQRSNTVLLKLTVRVPAGAFLPLAPQAVVVIPEGMTTTEPIEIQVEDPNDYEETADA
jgi:hypothetical protein